MAATHEELTQRGFMSNQHLDTWFDRSCYFKGNITLMNGYGSSNGQRIKVYINKQCTEVDDIKELDELLLKIVA